jgi:PTH1 family peptidyl-tRNA hydrolase
MAAPDPCRDRDHPRDLDLSLGRLRLRPGGSAGGHRGIRSIIDSLGTQDFARLRVGIGRPEGNDAVDYVLGDFNAAERKIMAVSYARAAEAVECIFTDGLETAMNRFNAERGRDAAAGADDVTARNSLAP